MHGLHPCLLRRSEYVIPGRQRTQRNATSFLTVVPQATEGSIPAGHVRQSMHSTVFKVSFLYHFTKVICTPPHGRAHTVSKCFVHTAMTLCPGGHEEHLLHFSLSFTEENVFPF